MALRNVSIETASAAGGNNQGAADTSISLFEQDVPFLVKLDAREGVHQSLGVHVATGRAGTNGTTRCVNIRLTDARDPFFLYTLCMLEDDYGRFKEQQELNVDFGGFPKHFVAMMSTVIRSESGHLVEFITETSQGGKLRIVEKTEFRQLEVLTLQMIKEGDVGQKRYLAERFHHFQDLYLRTRSDGEDEAVAQSETIRELRSSLETLRMERDDLSDRLKVDASHAQTSQATALAQVKDENAREIKRLQGNFEAERSALMTKIDAMQQQYGSDVKTRDSTLASANAKIASLESAEVHLQSQLRIANDTLKAQGNELSRLQQDNEQLSSYRATTSRTLTENELSSVSMNEQIKHLKSSLKKREEECADYRQQNEKRDSYVQVLTEQLRTAQDKITAQDNSLQKAHHIIGNQMQQLKGSKEKSRSLSDQLGAKDQVLHEAHSNIERLKAQNSHASERIDHFQSTVSALKEQLQKVEDEKRVLSDELQSSKDALTHMYKTASSVTPRIHSYSSLGAGGAAGTGYNASTLYSDFSKNMSTTNATAATSTAAHIPTTATSAVGGAANTSSPSLNTSAFKFTGAGGFTAKPLPTATAAGVAPTSNAATFMPRPSSSGATPSSLTGTAPTGNNTASSYFPQ